MKKIKYIFLTVTIALVTVFYIINIQGKDQQIISERLPKAVLIANNENQNPETIPSPQEVVKEIDDYARKHNVFIVMDIVTPADSEDFKPTYITFGTGKLASNMILFPKANRANNDLLGMGATYNILKGHGSGEELSQYLNQKFYVTASYFPTMSLIGEYYNIYGNPQAVTLLISIFLAFVGLAIL